MKYVCSALSLYLTLLLHYSEERIPAQALPTIPDGYVWSKQLPKPDKLTFVSRQTLGDQQAGWFEYAYQKVGDNWSCTALSPGTILYQPAGASVSLRPTESVGEPSCGFVMWRRGPFESGVPPEQRGRWIPGAPPNAGPWPRTSMPISTWHGGDYQRYRFNGFPFNKADYFEKDGPTGAFYRSGTPVGPLMLDGRNRMPITNPTSAPEVTLLSAVPNVPLFVACCWVDQFGRESELSDAIQCPQTAGNSSGCVEVSRGFQPPQGAVACRIYCGTQSDSLRRQPVFGDKTGSADWPLHLSRYYLHSFNANGPAPASSAECKSWLNPIQQDLEAGKQTIQRPGTWNLYCPLILKYDPNNFGRSLIGPTKLVQQGAWVSSAVIVLNQRDTLSSYTVTNTGNGTCAAIATSDFSGGQAFSNQLLDCIFENRSQDGYGLLVDDSSSVGWGGHTCSELLVRHCIFTAARPVKLEGNQTAKVRFDDRCTFNSTGLSRYPSETCAIEHFTPNAVTFDTIEGVNGNFRTFLGMYDHAGLPTARIRDVFLDHGCNVLVSYSPNTGGNVDWAKGDKCGIYQSDRPFFRLAEAPNCRTSRFTLRGLIFPSQTSILCYNLNQLAIDLDQPVQEVITPSIAEWVSRGLPYPKFSTDDWSIRPQTRFTFGIDPWLDSLPRKPILEQVAR